MLSRSTEPTRRKTQVTKSAVKQMHAMLEQQAQRQDALPFASRVRQVRGIMTILQDHNHTTSALRFCFLRQ